jgi:ATP-dependent RNA helicase RhlE
MTFDDLKLTEPILQAVKSEGYTNPTPIQAQAIPLVLKKRDILGCAQTGTGKTAAFAIPIIQLLEEKPIAKGNTPHIRCLVLTPTRELAIQIEESFKAYGQNSNLKSLVVFGGVSQYSQVIGLQSGVDILIATPGRLLDLMNQKYVYLDKLDFFVLDEADRMLDMGFVHDVKKVITKIPSQRQSLFFSATMPPAIVELADTILVNPAKVEVTPISSTANTINQVVYFLDKENKKNLLVDLIKDKKIQRVLIFTRTKHGADRVTKDLNTANINAQAIHGNKSQNARQEALKNFKAGKTRALVATDIAARGIDIDDLTHVINYELPNIPESYVHRIGRTGRAGSSGIAIAFCDASEKDYLKDIQKLIGKKIKEVEDHIYPLQNHTVEKIKARPGRAPRNPDQKKSFEGAPRSKSNSSTSSPAREKTPPRGFSDKLNMKGEFKPKKNSWFKVRNSNKR